MLIVEGVRVPTVQSGEVGAVQRGRLQAAVAYRALRYMLHLVLYGQRFTDHRNDGHTQHHFVCIDHDEGEERVEEEKVSHLHASLSFGGRRIDFFVGLEVRHLDRLNALEKFADGKCSRRDD